MLDTGTGQTMLNYRLNQAEHDAAVYRSIGQRFCCLVEFTVKMCLAVNCRNFFRETVVSGIPIRAEIATQSIQEFSRILCAPPRLVFIQNDRLVSIFAGSVELYIHYSIFLSKSTVKYEIFQAISNSFIGLCTVAFG